MTDAISRSNAISRSAALSMMDEYIDMARDDEMHHAMCVVAAGLAELPTLDVAPVVHAWWILKHVGVGHYWECSACRTNPCIYVTENTKFCPNCGARMDGEAE